METPLLRITVNGEDVAVANLCISNGPLAWRAFLDSFANLAPVLVGEVFNTMRIACDPELHERLGPQGVVIDLDTEGC